MNDKEYKDILYVEKDHVATITLNRPERYNAIREGMYEEIIDAIMHASWDKNIGAIVLTGAGDKAFCTGGDQGDKGKGTARGPWAFRLKFCTTPSATPPNR